MAKKLGTILARLGRRNARNGSAGEGPAVDVDPMILDDAPLAAPVLMPAVIFRQLIFDGTEVTPVWARPRPAPEPETAATAVATTDEPKATKRPRRSKPTSPPGPSRPRTRRVAKKEPGATDG